MSNIITNFKLFEKQLKTYELGYRNFLKISNYYLDNSLKKNKKLIKLEFKSKDNNIKFFIFSNSVQFFKNNNIIDELKNIETSDNKELKKDIESKLKELKSK